MTSPNEEEMAAVQPQDVSETSTREPQGHDTKSSPLVQIIATVGAIQVFAMAFTLVRSKIIAVTAGPEGVGIISMIDQVAAFVAQVSTFSLPFASVKFLSEAHSESPKAFANLYLGFLRALLLISFLGTAVGVVILLGWPAVLGRELVGYTSIVFLAFLAIPATNLSAYLTNVMGAAQRASSSALYGLINTAVLAALAGGGLLLFGLHGYYIGSLVSAISLAVGGIYYLFREEGLRIGNKRVDLFGEFRRYPKVLNFAAAMYVVSFALPVAHLVARYRVLREQGLEAAGLLQSAMALGLALALVMRQGNALFLLPAMNRRGDSAKKFREAVEYLRALSLILGIVALPLVLFPDWWLFVLYSRKFVEAGPFVYLFVLASGLALLAGVNLAVLIGLDSIGTSVVVNLTGLIGIATISWWLVPYYGISGVAIAFLFNGVLVFALSAWCLSAHHRLPIHRAIGWLPYFVMVLIGASGAASTWVSENTLGLLLTKTGIWAIFTVAALRGISSKNGGLLHVVLRKARLK